MKKMVIMATLVAGLLLATGCGKTAETTGTTPTQKDTAVTTTTTAAAGVIFQMEDMLGDDNGPGTYTYPTDKVFVPGVFDLKGIKIADGGSTYDFTFTIAVDFKNDWKNFAGWDVQMFDVYMNLGTGKNKQAIQGRHVKMEEGWDVALMVGPDKPARMQKEIEDKNTDVGDDVSDFENLVDSTFIPDNIAIAGNTMTVKIAKDKIGDLTKMTAIQVFMAGSEGYPTKTDTYNRVVNEYASQWRIGGGNDYFGDPNVMDILGDNKKLGSYKSDEGVTEYPVINMVKVK